MDNELFAPFTGFLQHTLAQVPLPTHLPAARLNNGVWLECTAEGVLHIQPPLPATRQLIISAGIHGNETAPIEVCDRLITEILEARWAPRTRALVIFGNPPAMVAGKRFMDFNLNRLFNGAHRQPEFQGLREQGRAAQLEALVREFIAADSPLVHLDLHTAIRDSRREKFALYPFVPGRALPLEQMQLLLDSEVETVLYQHAPGTTFASWTASTFAAESFTVELGKVRPFGENDHARFGGIERSLRRLLQGRWPTPGKHSQTAMHEFRVVHEIINSGKDFVFHIPGDVANFTEYAPGSLIWEDAGHQYRVGGTPESIVFPNPQVPVGQRAGLMVMPC